MSSARYLKRPRVGDRIEIGVGWVTVTQVIDNGRALRVADAIGREHYLERAERGHWLGVSA